VLPSLRLWAAHAIGQPTPWGAGAQDGPGMVIQLPRQLGGLHDALPQEGRAGPAIALALEQLQTIVGCSVNQAATLAAERSGSGSTTR
jgi:hypothetical protein